VVPCLDESNPGYFVPMESGVVFVERNADEHTLALLRKRTRRARVAHVDGQGQCGPPSRAGAPVMTPDHA
jgi:hypothetical protein